MTMTAKETKAAIEQVIRESAAIPGTGFPPGDDDKDGNQEEKRYFLRLIREKKTFRGADRVSTSVIKNRETTALNVFHAFLIGINTGMFAEGGIASASACEFHGQRDDTVRVQLNPGSRS